MPPASPVTNGCARALFQGYNRHSRDHFCAAVYEYQPSAYTSLNAAKSHASLTSLQQLDDQQAQRSQEAKGQEAKAQEARCQDSRGQSVAQKQLKSVSTATEAPLCRGHKLVNSYSQTLDSRGRGCAMGPTMGAVIGPTTGAWRPGNCFSPSGAGHPLQQHILQQTISPTPYQDRFTSSPSPSSGAAYSPSPAMSPGVGSPRATPQPIFGHGGAPVYSSDAAVFQLPERGQHAGSIHHMQSSEINVTENDRLYNKTETFFSPPPMFSNTPLPSEFSSSPTPSEHLHAGHNTSYSCSLPRTGRVKKPSSVKTIASNIDQDLSPAGDVVFSNKSKNIISKSTVSTIQLPNVALKSVEENANVESAV